MLVGRKGWACAERLPCFSHRRVAAGCSGTPTPHRRPARCSKRPRPRAALWLPANLRGSTYDDFEPLRREFGRTPTVQALNNPTIRVVSTRWGRRATRRDAGVHQYAYTIGELADSSSLKRCSVGKIPARTKGYIPALADITDLWEIGDEMNGEWLSKVRCPSSHEYPDQAQDVMSKVEAIRHREPARTGDRIHALLSSAAVGDARLRHDRLGSAPTFRRRCTGDCATY